MSIPPPRLLSAILRLDAKLMHCDHYDAEFHATMMHWAIVLSDTFEAMADQAEARMVARRVETFMRETTPPLPVYEQEQKPSTLNRLADLAEHGSYAERIAADEPWPKHQSCAACRVARQVGLQGCPTHQETPIQEAMRRIDP